LPAGHAYNDDNPIAAFATIPGSGALTLIRCSGKGAIEAASSVFAPDKLKGAPGNSIVHGWIVKDGEKIDETLVSVFRAPKSYTGEDSLDISCHGGASAGKAVMAALSSAGFRDALPGEFTFRAFVNGKLDLTKAESVMELVCAKTEISLRHAVSRLSGSLQTEIEDIKKSLVQVLSGAEIYLDYSEDEIGADIDEDEGKLPCLNIALEALERLKKLSASWRMERIYQEGVTVVIAGRPNAGKSSLFNALLKEDRSIVTEIPGTTRDWIEAWVTVDGVPVRLVDTAGLRESAEAAEKIGVDRSRKLLQEADLVLYLIDGAQGITNEDRDFIDTNNRQLLIWNKADITKPPAAPLAPAQNFISASAKTGEGLAEIYAAVSSAIQGQAAAQQSTEQQAKTQQVSSAQTATQQAETQQVSSAQTATQQTPRIALQDAPITAAVGTERQKKLVDAAVSALEEALALARREEPLDLIAPLLREAVNSLGEITGEVSTADILEEMFSRFCVGK
jgi:tRNA modification GTPase